MDDTRIIAAMTALAHPIRLSAYRIVAASGSEGVWAGAVAELLSVRPNVLTPHLAALVRSGLVRRDERGRRALLTIDAEDAAGLRAALIEVLGSTASRG